MTPSHLGHLTSDGQWRACLVATSGGLGGEEGGLDNNYTIVTFHSELGKITAFLPAVLTQR